MGNNYNSKEIHWIREFYPGAEELKPKELNHVLAFGIIWNIFEGVLTEISEKGSFYQKFDRALKVYLRKFNKEEFEDEFNYFSRRYQNQNIKKSLNFREGKKYQEEEKACKLVSNSLQKGNFKEIPTEEIIQCLIYLTYRLRNNLFHGLKPFISLPAQNENFKNSNSVLIKFIDTIKR